MTNFGGRAVGPPVFVPYQHPELKQLGRKTIHIFLRERERYLRRVQEAQSQGSAFKPVKIVASVDFDLLTSLIELDTFEKVTKIDDLSDEVLLAWLQAQAKVSLDSYSPEELEAMIKKSVAMRVSELDPRLRVISLFTDYKTFLREKNIEGIITDNPKVAVEHICSLLRPPTLKKKIENDLALHKTPLRKDWKKFFQYVVEKAVACNEFVDAHEKQEQSRSPSVNKAGPGSPRGGRRFGGRDRGKARALRSDDADESGGGSEKTSAAQPQKAAGPTDNREVDTKAADTVVPLCLNKDTCAGQRHYMRDCKKTSTEKRRELLGEFRAKHKPAAIKRVRFTDEPPAYIESSNESDGRFAATLADKVSVVVNGDYGADHAALGNNHLLELAKANLFVPIIPLEKPITMDLAADGQTEPLKLTADRKARITTTLTTAEGPLRMRNIEYLVFKEQMPEVLLSRPLLMSMGFNLDEHLARVRRQYHNTDFSNIGFDPDLTVGTEINSSAGRLARLVRHKVSRDHAVEYLRDSDDEEVVAHPQHPEPTRITDKDIGISKLNVDVDIGSHSDVDVRGCLQTMIEEASENGLPNEYKPRLRNLLENYADIFRIKLGSDPPVDVPPMAIRLQPDAVPVRVKMRRYTAPQREFLREKVTELEDLGLIYRNSASTWACAAHVVPKPGSEMFRFTTDLRPVNKVTITFAWPMPDLESATAELAGKKCFATIDLCQGYWQLPLAEDSQECQSFITPDGVYTPTRVMHGQRNAVAYCQSSVQQICSDILESLLQWLDDLLFHAKDAGELLDALEKFFAICKRYNLKLHAKKCKLFLFVVRWCGRIISEKGIQLDPSRLQALLDMENPTLGSELQQFICAANWMRTAIPQFNATLGSLAKMLEDIYTTAGKRTKKAVSKYKLADFGWNNSHTEAFEATKKALANSVVLSHPDQSKTFCLFTDASDRNWAGILTQIPKDDLDVPFIQQGHEPLAFLSGSFTGASHNWSTPEKEAAAIIYCVERLDYLLYRPQGFHLFTDHSNLVFIYHPEKSSVIMSKTVFNKVQRWSMLLSNFEYTIVHIKGEDNCWADLLSRWGAKDTRSEASKNRERKHMKLAALLRAPVAPELDPDLTWPSFEDIVAAQQFAANDYVRKQQNAASDSAVLHDGDRTSVVGQHDMRATLCAALDLHEVDGILKVRNGATWIPDNSSELQMRISVVGHCGRSGHRGYETTLSTIKDHFFWKTIDADIDAFSKSCLHCALTLGGKRIPRPFGHALHADKPNELIHFDFLFMGESSQGYEYVMIIKDDASMYLWLQPASDATAEAAVKSLVSWFSAFGVVPTWISDRGSHFKNNLMDAVNKALHTHHHFTAPNTPQTNGTVERVCREVLRGCRALLSEFRLKEKDWPLVLPIVQSVLDHSKLDSLGGRAPITMFTGLPADNPLRLIVPPSHAKPKQLDEIKALRLMNVESLAEALQTMHREVAERRNVRREAAIRKHNERTHVQPVNFSVGDYVLVAKRISKNGHKLQVQWRGPQRINRVESNLVFECQDLINEQLSLVHANRLKFYADSQLNVTQELLDTIDHNDPHYNTVTKLLDLRYNRSTREYEVQAKWRGFSHEEPTWEPLANLHEDIPEMLENFLQAFSNQGTADRARCSLRRHEERGV